MLKRNVQLFVRPDFEQTLSVITCSTSTDELVSNLKDKIMHPPDVSKNNSWIFGI